MPLRVSEVLVESFDREAEHGAAFCERPRLEVEQVMRLARSILADEQREYSGPGADGELVFSEDFSGAELDSERWQVFDFTTGHVQVKEIALANGEVRFDTQATGYRLLEESAFESDQPFELDFTVDEAPLLQTAAADALRAVRCYDAPLFGAVL